MRPIIHIHLHTHIHIHTHIYSHSQMPVCNHYITNSFEFLVGKCTHFTLGQGLYLLLKEMLRFF